MHNGKSLLSSKLQARLESKGKKKMDTYETRHAEHSERQKVFKPTPALREEEKEEEEEEKKDSLLSGLKALTTKKKRELVRNSKKRIRAEISIDMDASPMQPNKKRKTIRTKTLTTTPSTKTMKEIKRNEVLEVLNSYAVHRKTTPGTRNHREYEEPKIISATLLKPKKGPKGEKEDDEDKIDHEIDIESGEEEEAEDHSVSFENHSHEALHEENDAFVEIESEESFEDESGTFSRKGDPFSPPIFRETVIKDDAETRRRTKITRLNDSESSDDFDSMPGSFVRTTPIGIETRLVELAKQGYAETLQSAAVNALMSIDDASFCSDITQNAVKNKNYIDPKKTKESYLDDDNNEDEDRFRNDAYVKEVAKKWLEEDFANLYKDSETLMLMEQYEIVEKALEKDNERKRIEVKTELVDLPIVSASYIVDFLREPSPELKERPCIADKHCVSHVMFDYMSRNTALIPTGMGKKSFVLREFLLPNEQKTLEQDLYLGVSVKDAYFKIPRKHCILCNRYWTTMRASRIAAGIRDVPKNTIQDHRNTFGTEGEYSEEDMLCFSSDYCGIIGNMVAFDFKHYAPGHIECKYNPTTTEEKIRGITKPDATVKLKCWIEKNLISYKEKHQRGILF
jgi:hypothetical protein